MMNAEKLAEFKNSEPNVISQNAHSGPPFSDRRGVFRGLAVHSYTIDKCPYNKRFRRPMDPNYEIIVMADLVPCRAPTRGRLPQAYKHTGTLSSKPRTA